jgi:hypothetical protein
MNVKLTKKFLDVEKKGYKLLRNLEGKIFIPLSMPSIIFGDSFSFQQIADDPTNAIITPFSDNVSIDGIEAKVTGSIETKTLTTNIDCTSSVVQGDIIQIGNDVYNVDSVSSNSIITVENLTESYLTGTAFKRLQKTINFTEFVTCKESDICDLDNSIANQLISKGIMELAI